MVKYRHTHSIHNSSLEFIFSFFNLKIPTMATDCLLARHYFIQIKLFAFWLFEWINYSVLVVFAMNNRRKEKGGQFCFILATHLLSTTQILDYGDLVKEWKVLLVTAVWLYLDLGYCYRHTTRRYQCLVTNQKKKATNETSFKMAQKEAIFFVMILSIGYWHRQHLNS